MVGAPNGSAALCYQFLAFVPLVVASQALGKTKATNSIVPGRSGVAILNSF